MLIRISPDLLAEVGFRVLAELAFAALGNVEWDDRVSWGGNQDNNISNHDNTDLIARTKPLLQG